MTSQVGRVVQHLRVILDHGGAAARDGDLLQRFAAVRDESAFAVLLHRHGPLVFGVCRRILHSVHDAEDAFQATFLVLARRASSIRQPESLASWLYEVAYRLARKMKADLTKRRLRDEKAQVREPAGPPDLTWREMQGVLDEELRGLPDKHRQPLLLCYLEGLTQEEAAEQLGWPRGTLKRRLERGRELLKSRLTRRGLSMGAAMACTLPAGEALALPVPSVLAAATLRTVSVEAPIRVLGLADGVLRTMFHVKLKLIAVAVLLGSAIALAAIGLMPTFVDGSQPDGVSEPRKAQTAPVHKGADALKLTIEPLKADPTLRQVNSGKHKFTVKLENTSAEPVVVWTYLTAEVHDKAGKKVENSMALGRFGVRPGNKSVLETLEFVTIKPKASYTFPVNLQLYGHDPEMMLGWKLPAAGDYTLLVHYKYDRAAAKKRYGEGTKDIDGAKQPWNRAVEFDRTAEMKFTVAPDKNEMPQARLRLSPVRDQGWVVDLDNVFAAAEARGWTSVAAADDIARILARGHRA